MPPTPSRAPSIAILLTPDRDGTPLYRQLYQRLRTLIVDGGLPPGTRLPSARVMAADLQVSRTTIESALDRLTSEGFLARRVGSGTVVLDPAHAAPFGRARAPRTTRRPPSLTDEATPVRLSALGQALRDGGRGELETDGHMGGSTTDVQRFPLRTWNALQARVARTQGRRALQSGDPQGDPTLRQAIIDHARLTRGVQGTAAQVVILTSTQQALDLAARLLLSPGDVALVEDPGYPSARAVLTATGAVVRGVAVDDGGVMVERFAAHPRARLAYLTPSHQFPLGPVLDIARRLAVLEWADREQAWILEDDYDCEFQYAGQPVASLQGLAASARVLYIGTCNKVLFPGLRVAYAIMPPVLVEPLVAARRLTDGGPPALVQATLAAFITEGHLAAHLRRARAAYVARRNQLLAAIARHLGDPVRIGACDTGLHLTLHLDHGTSDVAIAAAAGGMGVGVAPLSRYHVEWPDRRTVPRGLLLSYGAASDAAIEQVLRAIAAALREHDN